jgi:hypothetical protein
VFNWAETLFGYGRYFSIEFNKSWLIFTSEVSWHIWKAGNDEIFQGRRRKLIEYYGELILFNIMMKASIIMEILKKKFMILLKEGLTLIYKKDC